MAFRLRQHLFKTKSKTEKFGLFPPLLFFICRLPAPWPTFGYYRGNSITHSMLINVFGLSIFDPKVYGSHTAKLGLYIYNRYHNALRLFDVLPNFPFATSETMRDYYL